MGESSQALIRVVALVAMVAIFGTVWQADQAAQQRVIAARQQSDTRHVAAIEPPSKAETGASRVRPRQPRQVAARQVSVRKEPIRHQVARDPGIPYTVVSRRGDVRRVRLTREQLLELPLTSADFDRGIFVVRTEEGEEVYVRSDEI